MTHVHERSAGVLEQELRDYAIRVRADDGHATFGAMGAAHDDLVTALALATLAEYKRPLVIEGY